MGVVCVSGALQEKLEPMHGITSAKRTHKVRPAVLVRESSTHFLVYLLDTCVRYSYISIFKSQKGSTEALNFRVITS